MLQLKLDDEELEIDISIADSHAKREVFQKYGNMTEEQSFNRCGFI